MSAEDYRELLRPVFTGCKSILVGGPVAGMTPLARALVALGAPPPFLLGSGIGTGELPGEDEATWHALDVHADTIIGAVRAYEAALADPPADARAALDGYDPDRSAIVLDQLWLDLDAVAGRRAYAPRPRRWRALEDKVVIDAFWDSLDIRRAPAEIVPVERASLRAAARRLDRGAGTAWAGDARSGFHGGAIYLRWVRSDRDATEAEVLFSGSCDHVRVMPFLEGIPCSIHGLVLPDVTIALRPVEMVTLRRPDQSRLLYAGCATFWDPPPADRDDMRALAQRVGEALRHRVGYRGAFTVDGVMTQDGFLPTELNPRAGAGLNVLARSIPELPLGLLVKAAQVETFDFRSTDLERLLVDAADRNRSGGGWIVVPDRRESTEERRLVFEGGHYRVAGNGEAPAGMLSTGPSDVGGFVGFFPARTHVPVGPSLAPRVIDAFGLADRELGTHIGPLKPARAVR